MSFGACAIAVFIWITSVLIYWPFVHRVKGGKVLTSLGLSAVVISSCIFIDSILYNYFGEFYFEHLFPQTSRAQEIAKGLYFGAMALLSTAITGAIVKPKCFKNLVLLWAGHQLIAILGFLLCFGTEF